jgi:hypothetical protein
LNRIATQNLLPVRVAANQSTLGAEAKKGNHDIIVMGVNR